MMKKIVLSFLWICALNTMGIAQVETNNLILQQAAVDYKIAGDANYVKALSLAKQKGWALSFSGKNSNKAVLVGVDNFGFPKYYTTHNNIIAAATTRANQLWPGGASGLNLSGSSANMKNKIAIWDGGSVLGKHVELLGRITQKDNPSSTSDHSTHVSGTLIASGVNPLARGMAYGAQGLIAYDYNNDLPEIFTEASNLLISNHSYGIIAGWDYNSTDKRWEFYGRPNENEDYKFGYYSDDAQALDSIAYNAPFYLMVKSAGNSRSQNGPDVGDPYFRYNASETMVSAGNRPAGISSNDGYDIISWDACAKNILTVGAVSGIASGYSRKEDVVMSSFSSWGPTDDGRIKPDIVADGVKVLSSTDASTTSYATFSGTSMASPNAAGSLFLLQEYYSKLKSGNFMRSATLKGLAIHTADEAGTFPGPDYQFGWGLLNVEKAAAVITAAVPANNGATSLHQLYENILNNGQTFTLNVIPSGKAPVSLSATICWTDVKGNVDTINLLNNRSKKLVNDLDIRITTGSGPSLRTFSPWTLDVANPSNAAVPGDNITDNVEKINVTDTIIPGQTYTIKVTHKGTLVKGSQAYSLLVSGTGGTNYCTSTSGGGGAKIDSVSFSTIHKGNPAGAKTYTNNISVVAADIEPLQTIPIFVKVGTADASANPRIVKVFIDYNNNGVFDANELAGTSAVIAAASGTYSANITTPGNLQVGNISLMRIIVQETGTASDITACGTYGKGETQDYRIRVVTPANDMSISKIVSPASGDCFSAEQYITVKIRNNGYVDQKNIPVTAFASAGGTTIANFSSLYPGTIKAFDSGTYTFQTPFVLTDGTAYIISGSVNLANDQYASNNSLVTSITTTSKPAAISGIGGICTTSAFLRVNNPDASNYFWYAAPSAGSAFAAGPTANTTTIPSDKTYYVTKEAKASLGPVNKLVFPQGGYNSFDGNYIKFNNTVPIVIETARLYIGNPGRIRITLGNNLNATGFDILSETMLSVYATNPNPAPGAVTGNPTNDSGAVYSLNIPVTSVGEHVLAVECMSGPGRLDSASIFRNNSIAGTATYPMSVPNIAAITGNSASGVEAAYYYFFYDMRVNTGACISDRAPVVAITAPTPVISQVADSLVSSISAGNQWYKNDTAITNAVTNHFKPAKPGTYKVIVTDVFGCQKISNNIVITVTAVAEVLAREIKLNVSPNPNNGIFNLSFEVNTKADLLIELISSSGQRVYNSTYPNFTGKFSKQISLSAVSSAFYVVKIQHNKKTYLQKILIQK